MTAKLVDLTSLNDWEAVLAASNTRPQLVFKHSNACPISGDAYDQLHKYLPEADPNVDYSLITVQTARPVSNEVEAKLQVTHESPQAILIRNGQAVWHTSHRKITKSALTEAIKAHH